MRDKPESETPKTPRTMKNKIKALAEKMGCKFTDETPGDPVIYVDAPEGRRFLANREDSLVYGLEEDRVGSLRELLHDLQMGLLDS
jgi:hypothetical protein